VKAAYDSFCKVETKEGCCVSVQTVFRQYTLKFRPLWFNVCLIDLKKPLQI